MISVFKPSLRVHGLQRVGRHRRFFSSYTIYNPPKSAPRQVPTPLVFVSAGTWDVHSTKGITEFAQALAEKGHTCLHSDLSLPTIPVTDSDKLMRHFESELKSTMRLSNLFFPPVLFARSSACIIAESFISSYPASGLCLISPPLSNASVSNTQLPTKLREFDFEPKFPIAIVAPQKDMDRLQDQHRLGRDRGVDKYVVTDMEEQETIDCICQWLEDIGI